MSDLLPCPFCGAPGKEPRDHEMWWGCSDLNCDAYAIASSAEMWNRRAAVPPPPAPAPEPPAEHLADLRRRADAWLVEFHGNHWGDNSEAEEATLLISDLAAALRAADSVDESVSSKTDASSLSVVSSVADLFPAHKASLTITHNDHKDLYQTVERWLAEQQEADNCWFGWVSPEERQRAIETDSVWTIQWYPNTPVGFNALAASTLDALLAAIADGQS